MGKKRHGKTYLTAAALCVLLSGSRMTPAHAEEIGSSWDEDTRVHVLRRRVATAINVYTDGTSEDVTHEEGIYDDVVYDILRVRPNEHTFLQVDFSETPGFVNELKDAETIAKGYRYAGGINAGYFINDESQYGRPVGGVRRHNQWVNWYYEKCVPAYGNGFATAYLDGDDMELKYHGWQYGKWAGDTAWQWWTGYTMDADFAVSGSFTYFADGQETDITNGDYGDINYRTFGRAVSILAQKPDKQYLLITFYGTVAEDRIAEFLGALGVSDAIRLDGGGSTQMVYETDLVKNVSPELAETASDHIDEEAASPIGYATVNVDSLRVRSQPRTTAIIRGTAINGERYQVYETSDDGTYTWYRIGVRRWIAGSEDWVNYEAADPSAAEPAEPETEPSASPEAAETAPDESPEPSASPAAAETAPEPSAAPAQETPGAAQKTVTVLVDNLNIRTGTGLSNPIVGKAVNGMSYPIHETAQAEGYVWYRIGTGQWIAGNPDWVKVETKQE